MTTETTTVNVFDTTESSFGVREKNTVAAAIGVAAGIGLTAMSQKANKTTVITTTAFGALVTYATYNNDILHGLMPDNASVKTTLGITTGVETALFGAAMNWLLGDQPSSDE